jgi:hypothetical protein
MAEHIPFVTSDGTCALVQKLYPDSDVIRIPLTLAPKLAADLPKSCKIWLDAGVDGMHDLRHKVSSWNDLMKGFANFEKIGTSSYQAKPVTAEVEQFVNAILNKCMEQNPPPSWISVPQIPLKDTQRNKVNRALASATGRWRIESRFSGKLILPLVFTHQGQINKGRTPRVKEALRCYQESRADGFWVVDSTLADDSGSHTLRNRRFPAIVALHQELNASISSTIRIAGPYWGVNLVLWAKDLVDYPAIGVGSGYQFLLAGGQATSASSKVAIPLLRRRVGVGPQLEEWLETAITRLASAHPAHIELSAIKTHLPILLKELKEMQKQLPTLREPVRSRRQVAAFYKQWFDLIARAPKAGRSMALFQDLSAAYALGKSLQPLEDEGTARRPESVAEALMMICL